MLNEMPVKETAKTKSAPRLILAFGMVLIGLGLIAFGVRGISEKKVYIKTPKMLIKAEVLDSSDERIIGLSGRDSLGVNQAALFVFSSPDNYGIWMKDMKFPIDIVWLNSNRKIVTIRKNVQPSTYPMVFYPDETSQFIIELAANRASSLGIKVGQTLSW